MINVNLNVQPEWKTVEVKDERGAVLRSIELQVKKLGRLLKLQVASMLKVDFAGAVQLLMDNAVLDWRGVCSESGEPIAFSRAGLDVLLGLDDELGNAVQDFVFDYNSMGKEETPAAADPTPPPSEASPKPSSTSES